MGLSIRVKDVKPLDDMYLLVHFENGVSKRYDTKQLIEQFPVYKKLKDVSLFKMVQVDCGGSAVAWNEDIDISEVELWEGGEEINSLDTNFKGSIETLGLSSDERVKS